MSAANGDILLDDDGRQMLDDDGDVVVSDGGECPDCCGSDSWIPLWVCNANVPPASPKFVVPASALGPGETYHAYMFRIGPGSLACAYVNNANSPKPLSYLQGLYRAEAVPLGERLVDDPGRGDCSPTKCDSCSNCYDGTPGGISHTPFSRPLKYRVTISGWTRCVQTSGGDPIAWSYSTSSGGNRIQRYHGGSIDGTFDLELAHPYGGGYQTCAWVYVASGGVDGMADFREAYNFNADPPATQSFILFRLEVGFFLVTSVVFSNGLGSGQVSRFVLAQTAIGRRGDCCNIATQTVNTVANCNKGDLQSPAGVTISIQAIDPYDDYFCAIDEGGDPP